MVKKNWLFNILFIFKITIDYMRRGFTFLLLFYLISSYSFSQTGSIEINSGGFSFIPIFTSDKPHIIFRGSTNDKNRFSLNLLSLIMLDGLTPSNYMLTARYKIFDKKFKFILGAEFPGGYRVLENEEYRSRNVYEIRSSYPINSRMKLSFLYMHGVGRNFDMTNNFYSFYFHYQFKKIKIQTSSQIYILYSDLLSEPSAGLARKISLKLKEKILLNIFINRSFLGEEKISNRTIGLEFNF